MTVRPLTLSFAPMDPHRLLSNAASSFLIGLFHSRAQSDVGSMPPVAVPQYLSNLGCMGAWSLDLISETWSLSCSLVESLGGGAENGNLGPDCLNFQAFIHPDDREFFDETLIAAKRLPGLRELKHRITLGQGGCVGVRSYIYGLGTAIGATCLVGIIFDTTHESQAAHSLRAMNERSKLALRESQDGLFDWNIPTGRVSYNVKAAELLGLAYGQLEDDFENLVALVHPEDQANTMATVERHLQGESSFLECELRIRFADGQYHWVQIRGKALCNLDGKPDRLVGLSTDINARKSAELALRESEDWLRGAVEGSFDAIQILKSKRDEAGAIVDFELLELNSRVEEIAGRSRADMIGKLLSEVLPSCRSNGDFEKYVRVVESRIPFEEERIESTKNLGTRWFHIQGVPVGDGISVTIADITDRKESERVLVENQRFIEKLATSLPEFVYVVDVQETVISYQNRDFLAELGYPSDMFAKGMLSLCDLVHLDDLQVCEEHRQAIRESADDDVVETTCRIRTANDDWRWFQIRSVVFRRDDLGAPLEVIRSIHDISARMQSEADLREKVRQLRVAETELRERQTQLEELNKRLAALATTDGLTGLYNYRAFQEKLAEETRRARRYGYPLSVVFGDVDDFKAYNDRFGHPAGDERLRQFALLLRDNSRDSDFVARYGGEEFAMILINTTAKDAAKCAQRVVDQLNRDIGHKQLTASFGCVQLEQDDMSTDDLIRRADECLYSAKRQGKNRVIVSTNATNVVAKTL